MIHTPEESPYAGRKPTHRKKAHTQEENFTRWKKTHNLCLPQLGYLPSNFLGSVCVKRAGKITLSFYFSLVTGDTIITRNMFLCYQFSYIEGNVRL